MKRLLWIFAVALSMKANAVCMDSDNVSLILGARDRGESVASIKKGFFPNADPKTLSTVDQAYHSKTKAWDADDYSDELCGRPSANANVSPADRAQLEKFKQASYESSFHRMPNIPGICVGEECSHIRKIQRWNAEGKMIN